MLERNGQFRKVFIFHPLEIKILHFANTKVWPHSPQPLVARGWIKVSANAHNTHNTTPWEERNSVDFRSLHPLLSSPTRSNNSKSQMGFIDSFKSIDWELESFPSYEDFTFLPFFALLFPTVRFFLDRFVFEVFPFFPPFTSSPFRLLCLLIFVLV